MKLTLARARTPVMNNTYFTVETVREKEGLSDIAVAARRLKNFGPPDRLYEIHIDQGLAKTSIKEYPDKLKAGWRHQFNVSEAKSVSITFDGRWNLNNKGHWNQVTHQKPYIFWVDLQGKLYVQLWDEVDTKRELASNITKVASLRGWKNANIGTHDQGVICGYIKEDGRVYYRNFCEQPDGSFIWEVERELPSNTGNALNLSLFLTNDYRVGFVVENTQGKISWHITTRNWASMAIKPDTVFASPGKVVVDLIPVSYNKKIASETLTVNIDEVDVQLLYTKTDNQFITIENIPDEEEDWGKILIFEVKNELYNLSTIDFELVDIFNRTYYPDSIETIGSKRYKLIFDNFNDVDKKGTLKFRSLAATNGVGDIYEPFEMVFSPKNLVPTSLPLPEVEAIWNE